MAVKDTNERLTINISKELLARVDKLAEVQGTTRSLVITNLIEMTIESQIKVWEMMRDPNNILKLMEMATIIKDDKSLDSLKVVKDYLTSTDKQKIQDVENVTKLFEDIKSK